MSTPPVKTLPQEIIFDILLRLPVKSLCRFRCVSKTWLSMITDPHFINSHLHDTNNHKLILASHSLYSIDHEATPIDEEIVSVELDFPLKSNPGRSHVQIFGSCNGLVCIMPISKVFFLFNPSTRESMRIPDFKVTPSIERDLYGFGYSQIIDDYKFVKVVSGSIVCVFSVRTCSWKRVQDFHYLYPCSVPGTPLNGAIHWVLNRPGGACVLAAFDLVEESFKDLPLPDACAGFTSLSTGVPGGCLCVSDYDSDFTSREFWVMKEYGVKKSWTEVLIQEPYHVLKPLCYWKNSKMLLAINEHQLVLCNPKDGTCKDFMVFDIPDQFDVDIYVESLVPLDYNKWN